MNKYIGHELQIYGVEEYRLCGGKGDGMKMLHIKNAKGLDITISIDRAADIVKASLKGDNFGYFSPCGYVAPQYYDDKGAGFLKSFTAGFFTTCGLTSVGTPSHDAGEDLPLHGTISNTPCENIRHWIENNEIHIIATIRDGAMFSHKLILEREYIIPIDKNEIYLTDKITNIGGEQTPLELLYHCNMGYPLLSEDTIVSIPSTDIEPRNDHAATDIENCLKVIPPQSGYEEMCYFHKMKGETEVSIFNTTIKKGLKISYNADDLKYFTQWKMFGEKDYVMGLEPGNCLPIGRAEMRKAGILEFLNSGESKTYHIKFSFVE